ncbi:hypothetical protein HYT95_02300 [Candidatus Peregrinibacteria bacterium]|nr:hypothetical protein [Candidatus Peregrinibacteria bacterium]
MKKSIYQAKGKLILSGEYAVVFGYPGIAIPAPFTTTVTFREGNSSTPSPCPSPRGGGNKSNLTITHHGIENEDYLHRILEEITKFTGPLSGHLTIENTIPIGRGMGSSTALVIALCRCLWKCGTFFPPPKGEGTGEGYIKNIALSIENAINPGHSGLDFAVIWENAPILFQKGKELYKLPTTHYKLDNAVLIDTGQPRETTPEMVRWVKECIGNPHPNPLPSKGEGITALQTIGHCTERLMQGESPLTVFPDHHRAQVALGVVPPAVQNLIAEIEESGGAAKIIGAGGRSGGGGIVLALAKNASTLAASYGYRCLNTEHCLHQVLG